MRPAAAGRENDDDAVAGKGSGQVDSHAINDKLNAAWCQSDGKAKE